MSRASSGTAQRGGLTPDVRASDEDRLASAARLAAHAAAGRLSFEELEQRVAAAHAAVFTRELAALEADLPDAALARSRRSHRQPSVAAPAGAMALAIGLSVLVGHPVAPLFALAFVLWQARHRTGVARPGIERSAA